MRETILDKFIFNKIKKDISLHPAERGGIIGLTNGSITSFYYDSQAKCTFNEYVPSTIILDKVLDEWDEKGIEFIGFVHSHTPNRKCLSPSDIEYAIKVLEVFDEMEYLIIGVVGECSSFPLTLFCIFRDGRCEKMKYQVE